MDVPDIAPNKSFWNFLLLVALALLIINALFDLVNVFTGRNFKNYFNRPVSTFYPGKSGGPYPQPKSTTAPASTGS